MHFIFVYLFLMFLKVGQAFVCNEILSIRKVRQRHIFSRQRLRKFASERSFLDTIYAVSSGPVWKSGVAVVRLSGPDSLNCFSLLLKENERALQPLKPRVASLRSFSSPYTKEMIDKGIALWFPQPKSFTGEDVIELHMHGSRAVINSLFEVFESMRTQSKLNIRPAEPGEFSRRAFDNGKMDLTEVEGLADLLSAETAQQRRQALRQMEGYSRVVFEAWREDLLKCLAHTEAVIDFGDDDREGDINDSAMLPLRPIAQRIQNEIRRHLFDGRKGEIIREGVKIALVGQPNAGKSSILNTLAKRPAAIVSPIAGTTRDVVEVHLDIDGHSCIVRDTAGIRLNSTDTIEIEGIKRARETFDTADLRIFVVDSSTDESILDASTLFNELCPATSDKEFITVFNKIDLVKESDYPSLQNHWKSLTDCKGEEMVTAISCVANLGIISLEKRISKAITKILHDNNSESESVLITRERHRFHLLQCVYRLERFLLESLPMDAAAEEIRLAMMELGKITGRVDVEELLDIIFRDFCIGK